MCTAGCSTDDDCSDSDPGTLCKKGFICTWPTTTGSFCCQKMCVCHDFVVVPDKRHPGAGDLHVSVGRWAEPADLPERS